MKVIFKRLEDIPLESQKRIPMIVRGMRHLFDGATVRELYERKDNYICDGGWKISLRWVIKCPEFNFNDVEELFEL